MVFLADAVLSNMLNFVGGGHYIFVGGVNRRWRTLYARIAKDKDGNLVTRYSTAKSSISTFEFAVACGLDLAKDAFELSIGEFGPGVYEWAREHSYPLLVWVAMELTYPQEFGPIYIDSKILGVYSSVEEAKATAAKALDYGLDPEEDAFEWEGDLKGSSLQVGDFLVLRAEGFAVEDVNYAIEVELKNRLLMYVVIRAEHGEVAEFEVQGVFCTKKAANRKIDEEIARARARGTSEETGAATPWKGSAHVGTHCGLKSYEETYNWMGRPQSLELKVEWGKYLDAA